MPTENVELIPIERDIPVLLSLDTYQGMTDAEIEKLIAYHVECALNSDANEERRKSIQQSTQAQLDTYSRIEEMSTSVLQSMLSQPMQVITVSSDGRLIQNV